MDNTMRRALLVLEDGRVFRGWRFGADCEVSGEVVFNTSMMGYQEILGDPSYAAQIVVMTYPMIGNYGIAVEDFESRRPFLTGLVVKEPSRIASSWRHQQTLNNYLGERGIAGLCGFDTRALVRHLRSRGTMRGIINDESVGVETLLERVRQIPSMAGCDLARAVTTDTVYTWSRGSDALGAAPAGAGAPSTRPEFHVVAYDFGVKWNILRRLSDVGCRITVVPAKMSAEEVLAYRPDGVFLSNGPGDPEPVDYAIREIQQLIGKVPIFGICLGHQLLCLACGGESFKLPFGHRGANHPVMDLDTRRVAITAQNHGFAIRPESLPEHVEMTHVNLNDQTLAGVRLKNAPAFSVQYHPEAAPGPHDASQLFERFAEMMRVFRTENKNNAEA